MKRILRLDRPRLRGPFGAQDEFILAATVQNLRKLAKTDPDARRNARLNANKHTRAWFLATSPTVGLPTSSTQSASSGHSITAHYANSAYAPLNMRITIKACSSLVAVPAAGDNP
jgi:hypothetical protein